MPRLLSKSSLLIMVFESSNIMQTTTTLDTVNLFTIASTIANTSATVQEV